MNRQINIIFLTNINQYEKDKTEKGSKRSNENVIVINSKQK